MSICIDPPAAAASGDEQPVLELPFDHDRAAGRSYRSSLFSFALASDLVERLASLAETESVSLSSICLAAYTILLSRYGNTQEVVLSCNGSPVETHCNPDESVRGFLNQVAEAAARTETDTGNRRASNAAFVSKENTAGEMFDVVLRVQRDSGSVELSLVYNSDLFERDTIERMSRHFTRLLEEITCRPGVRVAELEMMDARERELVLGVYAGSSSEYPHACLHELFAEQASLRPEAEAVVFGSDRLTYRELDQRSNQVAQFLVRQGIAPEDRVGIFMDRSAGMIVAMLGILKAGGAYVPIDPDYPAERLKFIAEDTGVRWVFTERRVQAVLPAAAPSIYLDTADSPILACSEEPVSNRSNPETIAVVIYTSGSTGKPKGASIPHRAAVRLVRDTNYVTIVPEDRIAQAGSPSFDAAIQEIWLALVNGATLVGIRRETLLDPVEFRNVIQSERISIIVLNTSYVHQIGRDTPGVLKGLRRVFFGGEAAEPGPLRELLKHVGPNVLVNGYGPAEGCVMTTFYEINHIPEDATTVSIGRPISNAQVYLLDSLGRPVPIGVQGEIYIGGEGVAHGYLNRPDLTAQRFVPDVFSKKPGRLLYRTGDLARMRPNGELEFRGRADEQVKIRGHRIELAEVREAIASHRDVKQVFLMVREDQPGDKRLVAYVTLRHSLKAAQDSLRTHTKNKLPAHMLPAAFIVVDSIPLNTNGKIDRSALPAPSDRPDFAQSYRAPEDDLEQKLVRAWQELLRVDHVGVHDNFFELGGHSLLAARLIARIEKETGENIPVATLFESPTVAQLAPRLRQRTFRSAWSSLVQLNKPQEDTHAQPFFCVHSLGANLVSFHKTASFMRGDRPVFGLQPHGLDGEQQPFDSIETMAAAYLSEVRKKQPHGPYYLGGVCIGGAVAYEMAQQLRAAGEEVALVALIDSYMPGPLTYLHTRPALTHYIDWHVGELLLLPARSRLPYLARWAANGAVRFARWMGWGERSSLARATKNVAVAHRRAILTYTPKPYAGKVVQLMCSDASHRAYEDNRLAWSTLVSGGFEIRIVPGSHLTMVEQPHVPVLAQELETCLDRAAVDATVVRRSKDEPEDGYHGHRQAA